MISKEYIRRFVGDKIYSRGLDIEERIIELQNAKTDLANRILSSDKISSATLSKDDLMNLL